MIFTIKRDQIIDKTDIIIVALNTDSKTFIVHVAIRKKEEMAIDSNKQVEIKV